jgi:hypothetical protein
MDVTIAFLYGNLRKVIYIEQPPWFIQHGHEHKVCHLFKSLYGLKQALQNWYDYFTHYLITLGYTKGNANSNIYIKHGDHSIFLIIALYVDDLLLISKKLILLTQANHVLSQEFKMMDNIDVQYCIGIQLFFWCKNQTMFYLKKKYITYLLVKFNMQDEKFVNTALEAESNIFH